MRSRKKAGKLRLIRASKKKEWSGMRKDGQKRKTSERKIKY
jgi:hypothetical protein